MKETSCRQSGQFLFDGRNALRVGLVLGSGGARGWAHVGVCLRLMEAGLRPHCIVGTSIGSVIGALAAVSRLPSMIELAHYLDWQRTARLFVEVGVPRAGLLNGRRIQRFLRELVGQGRIEDLNPRFAAVATDLYAEQAVVLDRGDIVSALRASLSIPGLFTPVRHQGRWLVDGGLVNPLPVDVARNLGAEVVIASEINLLRLDRGGVGSDWRGCNGRGLGTVAGLVGKHGTGVAICSSPVGAFWWTDGGTGGIPFTGSSKAQSIRRSAANDPHR